MYTKNSFAKVNIFLKITGKRDGYHTLISRFMTVRSLYDTIKLEKSDNKKFTIEGNFSCPLEKNSIYKAYQLLLEYTKDSKIENFFKEHKIVIDKKIPEFAGLGGGSSNAGTFLNLANEVLNLNIKKDTLSNIGANIGADVPFFVHGYDSANVSGIGEIVEPYEEDILDIQTYTPDIKCDTPSVYKEFSTNHYKEYSKIDDIKKIPSLEYLKNHKIQEANDLYLPACAIYPRLKEYEDKYSYFSGSGSTFFDILE
jgi:4-diphosphocytidyl-2-C-methyl-D-erythritol kinase